MQWLMAHMWTALLAAAVLGLLFGWAVRGLRLNGRLRKAEGERNIALGTLAEKDGELEALYAAGRSSEGAAAIASGANHDEELRRTLEEREQKLQSLTDELARSKAELSELREGKSGSSVTDVVTAATIGTAVAATAKEVSKAVTDEGRLDADLDENEASLQWRNRYLESRVRSLQEKVAELAQADPNSEAVDAGAEQIGETQISDVAAAKLKWQNDYLRQRVGYFEGLASSSMMPAAQIATLPEPEPVIVENRPPEAEGTSDQEVAKLRWRNRYLEGRLAYYEGDNGADIEQESGIAELAASTASLGASLTELDAPVAASDAVEDVIDTIVDEKVVASEPVDAPLDDEETLENEEGTHSSELETDQDDDVPAHRGERPLALEAPADGEGDDLTAIGGIGPKIQEVLNELGIFHYEQIASWSAQNVDWIDDHLAFEGRIEREQWVQQAAALSDT